MPSLLHIFLTGELKIIYDLEVAICPKEFQVCFSMEMYDFAIKPNSMDRTTSLAPYWTSKRVEDLLFNRITRIEPFSTIPDFKQCGRKNGKKSSNKGIDITPTYNPNCSNI